MQPGEGSATAPMSGEDERDEDGRRRLQPGGLAGRYEIQIRVGSGGAASVYRAYDRVLEGHVAVKALHPEKSNRGLGSVSGSAARPRAPPRPRDPASASLPRIG
jgi:serine/threonine protein kinase